MTAKLQGTEPSVFLSFDAFEDLIPIPMSLPQALKRSQRGKFPRAWRWGSRRARPLFNRRDLITWAHDTFFEACPELVLHFDKEIRKRGGIVLSRPRGTKNALINKFV